MDSFAARWHCLAASSARALPPGGKSCAFSPLTARWALSPVAFALAALLALFALLPIRLAAEGQTGLSGLCRARFGARVGGVCGALFFLLSAVTGGAMLAACAELSALVWPIRHAYALGFAVTAVLCRALCAV